MKKNYCNKCKRFLFVEDHHILPQSTFGKNEYVDDLCPTCHTEYHQYLGTKDLKNDSMEFHFEKYLKWLFGVGVVFRDCLYGFVRIRLNKDATLYTG